jgi:hypothetical protein
VTRRARIAEASIICAVFALSSVWATRYWTAWVAQGGQPVFYQAYFEPAVMIACGHGFSATNPQAPAVAEFLEQRRDSFSCSDIPRDSKFDGRTFQRNWFYLVWFVALSWRVLGMSWSGMGPVFGLLFGTSAVLVYGLCRLALTRLTSVAITFGVATSPLHLGYLPHLRDYAKEPFVLALFLIVGLLVTGPVRARRVIGLAAAYGVVLGVAYGFRTDFLINIPLLLIVLALFIEGGPFGHLKVKLAAVLAFMTAFVAVGWPVLSSVQRDGGCQWHIAILGLQSRFDRQLVVQPAPYDFGYAYADMYVYKQVQSFADRTSPPHPPIRYCGPAYDAQSGRYLATLLTTFPADFMTRGQASARALAELPFLGWPPQIQNWMDGFFASRGDWLKPLRGWGIWLIAGATLVAAAVSIRLGLFLLLFALYVGSYPAIQFDARHFFHLEFVAWWSAGLVVEQAILAVWRARTIDWSRVSAPAVRVVVVVVVAAAVLFLPLPVLRAYQTPRVKRLLSSYLTADKVDLTPVVAPDGVMLRSRPLGPAEGDLVEVDVDASRCHAEPVLTFKYDHAAPPPDLTRAISVAQTPAEAGVTRVFLAVFEHFEGVSIPASIADCVQGAYRLAEPRKFPLLLDATLPPDWQERPLHQRLAHWTP